MRSAGRELPSDPIGCSPRGSAMKRPLYYLFCAIACTSMVGATMTMAAIADAIQPQETAELQSQAGATNGDTGKTEDGTNTSATADTIEDAPQHPPAPAQSTRKTLTTPLPQPAPPPHPSEPKPPPPPRPSPPQQQPPTSTPPPQPKTASPSPSRGTTPPRAPRRPST